MNMKKHLWITAKETVSKSIGLEIGKDISEEDADKLIKMAEENDEFDTSTEEYDELNGHLGDNVYDSEGFTSVDICTKLEN